MIQELQDIRDRLSRCEIWAQNAYNVTSGPGIDVEAQPGIGLRVALQTRPPTRKFVRVTGGSNPYSYSSLEPNTNTNGGYNVQNTMLGQDPGNTTFRPLFERNGRTDVAVGVTAIAELHTPVGNNQTEQWIFDAGGSITNYNTTFQNTMSFVAPAKFFQYVQFNNITNFLTTPSANQAFFYLTNNHFQFRTTTGTCCLPCKPSTGIVGNTTATSAYYPFEESASPYADASGNNGVGTDSIGSTSQAAGRVGYGRKFTAGTNRQISLASIAQGATGNLDISFWIKVNGVNATFSSETISIVAPTGGALWAFQLDKGGAAVSSASSASYNVRFQFNSTDVTGTVPNDGGWHWIRGTWVEATTTSSIYVDNGTAVTATPISGSRTTPINVGLNNGSSDVDIYFDEFLFRTVALTTAEASILYNSGKGSNADCQPLQPVDGGTGTPLTGTGSPGQYLNQPTQGGNLFPTEPHYDAYVLDGAASLAD